MPEFTYHGDEGRFYSSLPAPANEPVSGETYTLKENPDDGRWTPAKSAAKKSAADDKES